MSRRILILAFDALRPDMVTPALMPNLCAFADAGYRFPHSRSTFPTETRVNQSAMVTGCYPQRHGIVGNKFLDPVAAPGKLFNTGDETQLAEGDRRLGGKLVDVPVLGEILAQAGKTLAVLSAGTPGGCRMLSHKAEALGFFRLALHRPDASVPAASIAEAARRVGPIPPHEIPSLSWLTYASDTYLRYIEPELHPDVTVLWYCEPDNSYHYKGIGTEPNLRALRHLDAELGRILDWRERDGPGDALQVVTLSDHGQITVAAEGIGLADQMRAAGFSVGETVSDGADAALALSSAGGIYVRDRDPALIHRLLAWLQEQPWCGPVSTRDGEGALRHDQLLIDHRRAPDIGLVLASDDRANPQGSIGHTLQNAKYPVGGGLHGGLHPVELQTWLAVSGDSFRGGGRSALPCGLVDVLPTILTLLGMPVPPHVQGRVLREALAGEGYAEGEAVRGTATAEGAAGYRAHLAWSRVGTTPYLDRGWVERA
ncbi:MAG: alkaline phosphatase family protein [Alphaproteobacteria bacterium]|nr:alkaline phosphatase family protein [Alphaproteobacteria bacterium]